MTLSEWKAGQPGLSTASLAALCGVQRAAMYRILSGERIPRWSTIDRIVTATEGAVTLADIIRSHETYNASLFDIPAFSPEVEA